LTYYRGLSRHQKTVEPADRQLRDLGSTSPLCPQCEYRPEVKITAKGVTIAEGTNTVRLSRAEWNELVLLIKSGTSGEA